MGGVCDIAICAVLAMESTFHAVLQIATCADKFLSRIDFIL